MPIVGSQFEQPIEKAKKLIGLKQSAFKDYIASRLLFINFQLHQAALFANTCIEKELKACLYVLGVETSKSHDTFKLLHKLHNKDQPTFERINPDYLKVLSRIYESRYHENLKPGYNFVIFRRKFLAELDFTYQILERKIRFDIGSEKGDLPKSLYELSVEDKTVTVTFENYLINGLDKREYLSQEEDIYEFRMLFNHEVIDAKYTIPVSDEIDKFIYTALNSSDKSNSFIISNPHPEIKNLRVTRNGILHSIKEI